LRQSEIRQNGCAVEARLYAENPENQFLPSAGKIYALEFPAGEGIRVDTGVEAGSDVTPFYDPMIAKIIAHGTSRNEALDRLSEALAQTLVAGPHTNSAFLCALLNADEFRQGSFDTGFIEANLARLGAVPRDLDAAAVLEGAARLLAPQETLAKAPLDPWSVADSFELTGRRSVGLEILADGRAVALTRANQGSVATLEFADHRQVAAASSQAPARIVDAGEALFVLRDGRQTELRRIDPLDGESEAAGDGSGLVEAPMHGRLLALFAHEGQRVEQGARVAIVEAMKMEHSLTAPRAGRVADISVAVGDQLRQGARMMTIKPEPAE
jgi:3-methylcrotonyl-CoA carboxylase alpha subunit